MPLNLCWACFLRDTHTGVVKGVIDLYSFWLEGDRLVGAVRGRERNLIVNFELRKKEGLEGVPSSP